MKKHIINSTEDLISLIEKENSYSLETILRVFNWYYEIDVILYSKSEVLFMLKLFSKNDETGNVLDYRVCLN